MGVASYQRGSALISLQFARDAYRNGWTNVNPDAVPAKPTPRPDSWGKPTVERARVEAEKIAARNLEKPESALDKAWAVHFVMERAKCGKSTAEEAVKLAGI